MRVMAVLGLDEGRSSNDWASMTSWSLLVRDFLDNAGYDVVGPSRMRSRFLGW